MCCCWFKMNNSTGISIPGEGGGGSTAATSSWVSPTSVSTSGKRIQREMEEINNDPPPDCSAGPKGDNLYHWVSTIIGPPGSHMLFATVTIFLTSLTLLLPLIYAQFLVLAYSSFFHIYISFVILRFFMCLLIEVLFIALFI